MRAFYCLELIVVAFLKKHDQEGLTENGDDTTDVIFLTGSATAARRRPSAPSSSLPAKGPPLFE